MTTSDIRLLFPPQFEPFQPYLSGPYLKSLLAHHHLAASVFDANIDFYDWMVYQANREVPWTTAPNENAEYLRQHIREAVISLQSVPHSLSQYRWAINVVDEYLGAISPTGVKIGLTCLKVGNRYSASELQRYLDRPDNIFRLYFEYASDNILGSQSVSTYLFSVVVIDQLPAVVAFTREIKQRRPDARVIIGGPIASRLHRQLSAVSWIAQAFDAIVPGEAQRVLPSVLGLSQTYEDHITPDFSDLDLDRYWSCRRVLPYLVAHGCKWGKCTFCSHHLTYDGYRTSIISKVVCDLNHLSGKHKAEYISFCDEYLTAAQLRELSSGLFEHHINVKWSTFVRPEPQFRDRNFMKRLYAGGCRMLMFGLESGSQRVINVMKKGTRVAHFRQILEACKEANIAVRNDFMVGFPGETDEEVRRTYSFIKRNREVIDTPFSSYSVAAFELRSGILVLEQTERFRVIPRKLLRGELDDQYKFESECGLSEQSRSEWRERLIRFFKTEMDAELICPQNKTHQLVLKDLFDCGAFDLPILQISPDRFASISVKLATGVETIEIANALRVINRANGGELGVDSPLAEVFRQSKSGVNLDAAFRLQAVWNEEIFARFITFLYRNDYIFVSGFACNKQPTLQDREVNNYA